MGRYVGKICEKHPNLMGARLESSGKCVGCNGERVNLFKKLPEQRERLREYAKLNGNRKGTPGYEKSLARSRKWYSENKHYRKAKNLERRGLGGKFDKYSQELKEFYLGCPEGFHVDHVVPIKGMDPETKRYVVCGLHVPWNLQYLTGEENDRKWAWFNRG